MCPQLVLSQEWPYKLLFPTPSLLPCLPCQLYRSIGKQYFDGVPSCRKITTQLPKNLLHFVKSYGLLSFPKKVAALPCAESVASSPHIPTHCYSPDCIWPSNRSPSFRLTNPHRVIIPLLPYECHMAKP